MAVIIAVGDDRIGVVQQRAPTEHGEMDLVLKGAREGRKSGAFQHDRAHRRMAVGEPHPSAMNSALALS